MNLPSIKYILLVCLLLITACRRELYDVPYPSDITKDLREAIGDYINEKILDDPDNYPLLQMTEHNSSAFRLIQTLYDQVTNTMRLDNKSPDSNRWQVGRQWKVRIIDVDKQVAFSIPGGDLYISRGILKALESESELYYLLAMEATLMNERYLLSALIRAYSTRTLMSIAENKSSTDPRAEHIILEIPQTTFDIDLSEIIGYQVAETICTSSVYSPLKAERLENQLLKTDQWLSTRPIITSTDKSSKCGNIDTKGLYQSEVLDKL